MGRRDELDLLLAVIDQGSFSAAARALGQTPSAVGKRVAQLEARLGVTLLHRSTRSLSLTSAGQHYAEEAREIAARLAALDEEIAAGSASLRGSVRMTAPIAFGRLLVAPAVIAFIRQHREVEIDLTMTDRNVDLVGEGVDVAVRTAVLADSGLKVRRLTRYHRAVCAAPEYLAANGAPVTPGDLADHRCLKLTHEVRAADWPLDSASVPGRRLGLGLRCNSLDALHLACLAGEGLACLPHFLCQEDVNAGRLQPVLQDHTAPAPAGDIAILRPGSMAAPRRVRVLIDYLADHLKRCLAACDPA